MLRDGVSITLAVFFYSILMVLAMLYLSFRTEQSKQLLLLALFFVFMPISIRQSTIASNDFPVALYGLIGLLLIMEFKEIPKIRYFILGYISLGFALGCKYQAVLYFPAYLLATYLVTQRRWKSKLGYVIIVPLTLTPFFVASPFFIRNLHYTGDPVWPMLQDLFHVKKDYIYQVTRAVNLKENGNLGFTELARSIFRLATFQQIIPFIWILWIGYYFKRHPSGALYKIGSLLYLCIWFLVQPRISPRYVIYVLPIVAIMAISFCEWFHSKHPKLGKIPYVMVFISIIAGMGFSFLYSFDYLKYQVTRDLKQYHQFTLYYEQQRWLNQNLKDDGKLLVIVGAGQTYYIDNDNYLAAPELSGLVDWTAIQDIEELKDVLSKLQVRYIFYDDRNWGNYIGGNNMMQLIKILKEEEGVSVLMEDNNVKLFYLRVFRKFTTTSVFVLDLGKWMEKT